MSSIDPGATGLPPVTPNIYSPTNSLAQRTLPLTLDTSVLSERTTSTLPPPDPDIPTLPIAEFYKNVNQSAIRQKIQEFLDAFNDSTKLKAIWLDAIDQAIALRDYITQIYAIVDLQNSILKQGQLSNARDTVNQAIEDYNVGVTGPGGDQEQTQILNNAINNYNGANSAYQSALQNYTNALDAQQTALNDYNSALNNWDNAMAAYLAGTITAADLENARAQFESAKSTFNASLANTNSAKSALDSAEINMQSATTALEAARDNYNAYVATRAAAVNQANTAIDAWNTLAARRNEQIVELNARRAALVPPLPPVPLIPLIPPINGLSFFTIPPRSDPSFATINTKVSNYNAQNNSINGFIGGQLNPRINQVNGTGYTPPINQEAGLQFLAGVTLIPVTGSSIPLLAIPTTAEQVNYTPFVPTDVVTIYLLPRLVILDNLKTSKDKANNYAKLQDNLNTEVRDLSGQQNSLGGAGASVAMSTISPRTLFKSPFLDSILSKQSFQAYFNVFGAPVQSPLIDQVGSITANLLTVIGLSSAGPANAILGQGAFGNINGESTVSVAVSLGFLKQISNVTSSEFLPQTILGLVTGEPSLSHLSAEQKQELANLISASVSESMLLIGLNDVARSLSIPGLTPQLLATVAGMTSQNALASFGGQLYAETLLAQHIEEQFTLTHEEAMGVSQSVLEQIFVGENEVPTPEQMQAGLAAALQSQLTDYLIESEAKIRAGEIADAVIDTIIAARMEQADIQKDAFRQAVMRGLQKFQNLDEREAARISGRIVASGDSVGSFVQSANGILPKVGLTEAEASTVVRSAVDAFNSKDPLLNPLSAPSLQKIASSADLAVLFKTEIVGALSSTVGNRRALEVAEDYGNLVFSDSNSVLNRLEQIDRFERKSISSLDNRVFERYLETTKGYKDPGTILDRLTAPGKALVSASVLGAPAANGISPMDNALGRAPLQG